MKKRLALLALTVLAVLSASAQMIAYQVTTNVQGQPGTPTVVDLQGTVKEDLKGLIIDADGNLEFNSVEDAKGFPIGFDFGFNGQVMKYFLIGTDGEIQLSATESISTSVHKDASNMFTNGSHDVFGIVTREGAYGYEDTQISYWLEGVEGTYALCIEYKNLGFKAGFMGQADDCGNKATIQYRLYQKSGNIEMKVNGMQPTDAGRYNFMRIGILGDASDFVQIQSYDGSVISARDNSISYSATSYPQDGTVWTFVAPEPCQTPATAPSALALTSTTTQINGTFTVGSADFYLVLATTDSELTETPVDKTKYNVGDAIGNATVIAKVNSGEFSSPNNMAQGTYNIFVFGFNSLCSNGPLYNSTPATAQVIMKPNAPEAIAIGNVDKTSLSVSVTPVGTSPVIVAITDEQEVNSAMQYLTNGVFGQPAGNYNVGDEIEGGGKVIFVGNPTEAINVSDLTAGKPYFFRAWSSDGAGNYSSEYIDASDVTAAELPWQLNIDETLAVGEDYLGWTSDHGENSVWTDFARNGYIYNQVSYVEEETGTISWYESPYIYLAEGTNRLKTAIAGTQRAGWMQGAWTLLDGEYIKFQVTKDGVEYKDILTIDKDNCAGLSNAEFVPFEAAFTDYAGEKVRLRIYIRRFSMGQTQFSRIYLEEKPLVDYPANIKVAAIDGTNVTIEWAAQEGATSYDVSYKQTGEEEWSEPQTVTETSITLSNLQGLSNYEARVRSNAEAVQSGWSDAIAFATGAAVPFEFSVADADAQGLSIWSTYTGELSESTTLANGGDIKVATGGWGGKYIRFMPYGVTSDSWLVSPMISLGSDNDKQYQATLTLTTIELLDDITLQIVVSKDGETFSSADVIGTITKADLPQNEESKDFTFDFTGYSGSIRLGYYIKGAADNLTWIQFDKMGLKENETPTRVLNAKTFDNNAKTIYSLSGQRLNNTQRGVNIVNGKKVAVK